MSDEDEKFKGKVSVRWFRSKRGSVRHITTHYWAVCGAKPSEFLDEVGLFEDRDQLFKLLPPCKNCLYQLNLMYQTALAPKVHEPSWVRQRSSG